MKYIYRNRDNTIYSKTFFALLRSQYSEIRVLNFPPKLAYINESLIAQPQLLVLDYLGIPAKGIMY